MRKGCRPFTAGFGIAFLIALVVLGTTRVWAQQTADAQPPITPDRPDYTEGTDVVAPGVVQFESGVTYEGRTRDGVASRSVTAPVALVRIGLLPRVEMRLGADGFLSENAGGVRTSGYSDFELSTKLQLLDQHEAGIDLAVITLVSLPTGANGFSSGGIDPTLKIAWGRDIPAGFDVSGNINFASVTDDLGRFGQRAVSVSFGHDLLAGFGGFIEAYSFTPMEGGERSGVTLDWGVSHLIGRDFQFDVEAGRGLTGAAPDWFVGAGFALRGRPTSRR
jgi:outer membrane putative beta-barrel porin/alpha-amylase